MNIKRDIEKSLLLSLPINLRRHFNEYKIMSKYESSDKTAQEFEIYLGGPKIRELEDNILHTRIISLNFYLIEKLEMENTCEIAKIIWRNA